MNTVIGFDLMRANMYNYMSVVNKAKSEGKEVTSDVLYIKLEESTNEHK